MKLGHQRFFAAFAIASSAFVFSACEKLVGSGTIHQRVQAYSKGAGSKTVTIEPGSYNAQIMFNSKTSRITLSGNQKAQFRITTPPELARNGYKSDFNFSAGQINQTFGLQGDANTKVTRGGAYNKSESCVLGTRREAYRHCYPDESRCVAYGERCRSNGRGESHCVVECRVWETVRGYCETRYRTVTDYGTRLVRGYDETSQELMTIKMKGNNGATLGTLNFAERPYTSFVETGTGECR